MKKIKPFIISEIILIILKILGGIISHSYTMLASSIFDFLLLIIMLFTFKDRENKKSKGIISSLIGFFFIILSLGIVFLSITYNQYHISFWIILFVFLSIIPRYLVNCIYTNNNYQKKKGSLGIGLVNSNMDFYNYGVILGSLVIIKFKRFLPILKYTDILGTILIAVIILYKSLIIIKNSFNYLEDSEETTNLNIEEIESCKEVKKIQSLSTKSYGGIRKTTCELVLNDGISMIDLNSFVINLHDFILKKSEISNIELVESKVKNVRKKVKVRSLKQDARNSRSGNSKTNTKKKNTQKKNKKS